MYDYSRRICCSTQVHVPDPQGGQTNQTSEFEAEKGSSQSHAQRMSGSCSTDPNSPMGKIFIGKICGEDLQSIRPSSDWLMVRQQCSRTLILSLKLPSSSLAGAPVPTEDLKDTLLHIVNKKYYKPYQ